MKNFVKLILADKKPDPVLRPHAFPSPKDSCADESYETKEWISGELCLKACRLTSMGEPLTANSCCNCKRFLLNHTPRHIAIRTTPDTVSTAGNTTCLVWLEWLVMVEVRFEVGLKLGLGL